VERAAPARVIRPSAGFAVANPQSKIGNRKSVRLSRDPSSFLAKNLPTAPEL
jgi:hypothetical protein